MITDDLILRLSAEAPKPALRPGLIGVVIALAIAAPVALFLATLGLRHDLAVAWTNPMVPFKTLLPMVTCALSAALLLRLTRPEARTGLTPVGYLLPGAAATALARAVRPHRPSWYTALTAILALGLIFVYVTLEVRHVFHGPQIGMYQARAGGAEQWAISMSWLALGIAFLAYGVWRRSYEARLGSAVVVLMAVAKVFLFDLAGLTGIWRALSFIVLGIVLIGIGLVYQNFVFGKGPKSQN